MRAAIRAKVTPLPAGARERAEREIDARARGYFEFARRAIAPPAPQFVAVGGLSGHRQDAGSPGLLAPALVPMPGAIIVRSDVERKALFGVGETETAAGRRLHREVTPCASMRPSLTGRAASSLPGIRSSSMQCSRSRTSAKRWQTWRNPPRFPLRGLFLTADLATRLARVGNRAHDASDADEAVARAQERYESGAARLDRQSTPPATPEETLARAQSRARFCLID